MAHIAGIEIPKTKRVVIGLTYIYGIGRSLAQEIVKKANIDENKKISTLPSMKKRFCATWFSMSMWWKALLGLRQP